MSRARFLAALTRIGTSQPPTIKRIIAKVATERGLPTAHIIGRMRDQKVTFARHEAVLRAHETGRYSATQIGMAFAGRDHTTILNSIKRGRELRQKGI